MECRASPRGDRRHPRAGTQRSPRTGAGSSRFLCSATLILLLATPGGAALDLEGSLSTTTPPLAAVPGAAARDATRAAASPPTLTRPETPAAAALPPASTAPAAAPLSRSSTSAPTPASTALGAAQAGDAAAASPLPPTPRLVVPAEAPSTDPWYRAGAARVAALTRQHAGPARRRARNVLLFVGDGMGVTTVTAARILAGQERGLAGEEFSLAFETLPQLAHAKTYNTDSQVPDSAGTMTALTTGVKTRAGMIGLDAGAARGDWRAVAEHLVPTLFEQAERAGLSTGVVTTTRVTHATPAACYAHIPHRDWELDATLPADARAAGFPDIARQLVESPAGDGLDVVLGGGRALFLPRGQTDPEHPEQAGARLDGRNLTLEFRARAPAETAVVWTASGLRQALDATPPPRRLLGLFAPSHMAYAVDRERENQDEPTLATMTRAALRVLAARARPWILMVEGGRIDHAHHDGNAYRALDETIEFSDAIASALEEIDLDDTLVIVTADHDHTFSMGGYPRRGNPILGWVVESDGKGGARPRAVDDAGAPYTTLAYANGPGAARPATDPATTNPQDPDYRQRALVPLEMESHSGSDVAIYAGGPGSELVRGTVEQNVIYHVIREALGDALQPSEPTRPVPPPD